MQGQIQALRGLLKEANDQIAADHAQHVLMDDENGQLRAQLFQKTKEKDNSRALTSGARILTHQETLLWNKILEHREQYSDLHAEIILKGQEYKKRVAGREKKEKERKKKEETEKKAAEKKADEEGKRATEKEAAEKAKKAEKEAALEVQKADKAVKQAKAASRRAVKAAAATSEKAAKEAAEAAGVAAEAAAAAAKIAERMEEAEATRKPQGKKRKAESNECTTQVEKENTHQPENHPQIRLRIPPRPVYRSALANRLIPDDNVPDTSVIDPQLL